MYLSIKLYFSDPEFVVFLFLYFLFVGIFILFKYYFPDFLISFSKFSFSSSGILKTVVLEALFSKSGDCVASVMLSGDLFCSFELTRFSFFFVCLVTFCRNLGI